MLKNPWHEGELKEAIVKTWRTHFKTILGTTGAAGLAFSLLLLSCAQNPPTAPPSSLAPNPRAGIPSVDPKRKFFDAEISTALEEPSETSADSVVYFDAEKLDFSGLQVNLPVIKLVGFEGDSIPIPMGKDTAYLVIVRGALDGLTVNLNLLSSLAPTEDGKMRVVLYNFFPEGLFFEKECYLIQPARFPEGARVALSWFDPLGGKWVQESIGQVKDGKVKFVIKHFSQYGAPMEALSSGGQ
jgi:hypothetical protein